MTTAFLIAPLMFLAAACGADNGADSGGAAPTATTDIMGGPASSDSASASPSGTAITLMDSRFEAGQVTVPVGTTVTVTNGGEVPHTWTSLDGGFDSGNLEPGQSYSFTFHEAGTYGFLCSYHSGMEGTITVS